MKGLLANLITIQDVSYATALEVVAGGRLYNIVVDTEVCVCSGAFCIQVLLNFSVNVQISAKITAHFFVTCKGDG